MTIYIRNIAQVIPNYLKAFPVVAVTGPRQSGKSTVLKDLLPNYTYVTFDDPMQIELFTNDPKQFLKKHTNHVIFDEVHRVPEIFNYIKLAVDEDRQNYGKYVITSSNQFNLIKKISESLAGRLGMLTLLPLEYSEMPDAVREGSIFRGGYPELVSKAYYLSDAWYAAYIDTYLHKDIKEVADIGNIRDFQRLIKLLAANTAQNLNMSNYAKDLGVSVNTIKKWISLLELSYIIFLLPSYHTNLNKRIIKSPKVYFYDTGLVSYLVGIKTKELFENGPMTGALFETYIVSEIYKKINHAALDAQLYYLRTADGTEIDLIIDWKTSLDFIEIKSGATFRTRMLRALELLMPSQGRGIFLYRGEPLNYADNIRVMNYQDYLEKDLI